MFEKVEKLRERANVTFEEAKAALDACGGDLLDAMVYLEKMGKVKEPKQSTYSTSYEEQKNFVSVKEKVKSQEKEEGIFDTIRGLVRGFIDKCRGNYFCAKRNGEVKFKMPVLAFLIVTITFWQVVLPVMAIQLFLGFQFSFYGKDDLQTVNDLMNKASDFANHVKEGLTKDTEEVVEDEETFAEEEVVDAEAVVVEEGQTSTMN